MARPNTVARDLFENTIRKALIESLGLDSVVAAVMAGMETRVNSPQHGDPTQAATIAESVFDIAMKTQKEMARDICMSSKRELSYITSLASLIGPGWPSLVEETDKKTPMSG